MSGGHLEFVSHYHFHQNLVILGLSFWFSFIIECFQRWAPLTAVIAVFILVVSLHNWLVLLRFSFVYFHILSLSLLSSSGSLLHTFTYFHILSLSPLSSSGSLLNTFTYFHFHFCPPQILFCILSHFLAFTSVSFILALL